MTVFPSSRISKSHPFDGALPGSGQYRTFDHGQACAAYPGVAITETDGDTAIALQAATLAHAVVGAGQQVSDTGVGAARDGIFDQRTVFAEQCAHFVIGWAAG